MANDNAYEMYMLNIEGVAFSTSQTKFPTCHWPTMFLDVNHKKSVIHTLAIIYNKSPLNRLNI